MELFDEVQHFSLRATTAVHHSVYFTSEFVQHLNDYRRVCAGWRKHKLTDIDIQARKAVGHFKVSSVYKVFRNIFVESLGILCRIFMGENIVAGGGQSVASHSTVVMIFIRRLSIRG